VGIREFHVTGVQTCALPIYINVALKYRVFNYIRNEVSRQKNIQLAQQAQPVYENAVSDRIAHDELSGLIEKEINKLPEKCRLVRSEERRVGKVTTSRCTSSS